MDRKLNVLIACEESQRTCTEFRRLGHNAFSCDLRECSGGRPEWHIQQDCLPLLNGDCEFTTVDGTSHNITGEWDIIIAHPPCTYFCTAGACLLYHKDKKTGRSNLDKSRYNLGLQARDFFMSCLKANCDHVAVENPTPMKVYNLPKESQVIQPWMFGERFLKRTCLWIRGLPNLVPDVVGKPDDVIPFVNAGRRKLRPGEKSQFGSYHGSKERSKTFPGIARAWAEQWTKYLHGLTDNSTTTVKDI